MDKKTRKYHSNDACLTWEVISTPIDMDGKAEIEVPKVVSVLMDPSTRAGLRCKETVECSINDEWLKRDLKCKLEYVRDKCLDKKYSSLDDDVNKIIAVYKKHNEISADCTSNMDGDLTDSETIIEQNFEEKEGTPMI